MSLQTLDARLTKIIFHEVSAYSQSGVPFLIGDTSRDVVKGEIYDPKEGQRYLFHGEYKTDKQRNTPYFHFYAFEILTDRDKSGIIDYIERYVPNFGRVRAAQLFSKYKLETIDRLRDDPTIALEIPGITPAIVKMIAAHFETSGGLDPHAYASVYNLLSEFAPPQRVITEVVKDFGSSSPAVITGNPYLLLGYRGMGWPTVDKIAINKVRYNKLGLNRFRAAILEALRQTESNGDTYIPRINLKGAVQALCGLGGPFNEAIDALVKAGTIEVADHNGTPIAAMMETANAERRIAERLHTLTTTPPPSFGLSPTISDDGLEGEQIPATRFLEQHQVAILTGAPGVGKTTVGVNAVVSFHEQSLSLLVVAPTGKAAKRIGEVLAASGTDVETSTIHRALGTIPNDDPVGVPESHAKFGHGRSSYQIQTTQYFDGVDVTVADECSMIDVRLMQSLLNAIPDGGKVILIGDENQLPSVDCGSVLRDLIAGGIPTFRLIEPRRNSGRIVKACHAIKDGRYPTPSKVLDLENGENWIHIELTDPNAIAARIVELHRQTTRDPLWDLQVLSAENSKKPIACDNLNRLLSQFFNARNHPDIDPAMAPKFAVLDKVVQTKNTIVPLMVPGSDDDLKTIFWNDEVYGLDKCRVVNGDMGQILAITEGRARHVIVRFRNPDRICRIPWGQTELSLAYCTTIHKFQGSGNPVIILPTHECFHEVSREQLYTAFSRSEDILITVGTYSSIHAAIDRKTIHRRKTRLASFVRERFHPIGASQ